MYDLTDDDLITDVNYYQSFYRRYCKDNPIAFIGFKKTDNIIKSLPIPPFFDISENPLEPIKYLINEINKKIKQL